MIQLSRGHVKHDTMAVRLQWSAGGLGNVPIVSEMIFRTKQHDTLQPPGQVAFRRDLLHGLRISPSGDESRSTTARASTLPSSQLDHRWAIAHAGLLVQHENPSVRHLSSYNRKGKRRG
jgi:hypothetical protein